MSAFDDLSDAIRAAVKLVDEIDATTFAELEKLFDELGRRLYEAERLIPKVEQEHTEEIKDAAAEAQDEG